MSLDTSPPTEAQQASRGGATKHNTIQEILGRRISGPVLLLLGLILLGLSLRLYGIRWGGFHPDEWAISSATYRLNWPDSLAQFLSKDSPLNPHWFNYGSLPLYIFRLVEAVAVKGRAAGLPLPVDIVLWRALSALADVATMVVVVFLGRRLWGDAVGYLAGLLYTLAVLPIQLSHFYAVDPLLTTFLTASLAASVVFVQTGSIRWGALASLLLGLALATKASGAVFGLPVALSWAYYVMQRRSPSGALPRLPVYDALVLGGGVVLLAFFVGQPYAFLDAKSFWNDILGQARMVRGTIELPYTIQYAETAPYLYHLRNLVVWGLGIPLGGAAIIGAIWLATRAALLRHRGEILLAVALFLPFLLLGAQQVKFMRYLLPLYPLLALAAALVIVEIARLCAGRSTRIRWIGPALFLVVTVSTAFYAFAFTNIYSETHTAFRMGRWVAANVPQGRVIAYEAWDQGIPEIAGYGALQVGPYDHDDERKVQQISSTLAQADYVFLFSNRAYGSLSRLPDRFPLMRHYYQELLSERLGFRVARVETTYPNLFEVAIADDTTGPAGLDLPDRVVTPTQDAFVLNLGHADESFTVYDHPKTILLENTGRLGASEIAALLRPGLADASGSTGGRRSLMMDPSLTEAQREGGTWTRIFAASGPAARYPLVVWLLVFEIIALAGLPLAMRVFRPLPDRGYLLGKILSLLIVAYLVWLAASLRILPFSRTSIILGILVLSGLSALAVLANRREFASTIRARWRLFLAGEALFLLAFLAFALLRAANPDVWHPFRGGEKPMDLAYLTAIVRSTYMPPYDPWFAGGYLNYYYFGQFIVATLIRLTGIVPEVAFNLAIPLLWSLTLGAAFSIAYNITEATRNPRNALAFGRGPLVAGLVAAGLVGLAGNLDGAIQVIQKVQQSFGPILAATVGPWETGTRILDVSLDALSGKGFDYWRSSRMVSVPGSISITEFPFFTFLFADLHAHLIALPITLLALGLGLALARAVYEGRTLASRALPFVFLAMTLGALYATNTWDYPVYLLAGALAVALAHLVRGASIPRAGVWAGVTFAGLLILSLGLFRPYLQYNESFYTDIVSSPEQTPVRSYLAIFGLPLFLLVSALAMALWRAGGRQVSLSAAAGEVATPAATGGTRTWGVVAVVFGGALVVATLALTGYGVVALNLVLLIALAGLLLAPNGLLLPQRTAFAFAALALVLIAGVDLFAINDHLVRMNTIFRVYTQAWVLLSLAGGYFAWWLTREGTFRRIGASPARAAFAVILGLLVVGVSIYPILGTRARLADRVKPLPITLDGMAFMDTGTYVETGNRIVEMRWEREAIEWLRGNAHGSPVVAEAVIPLPPNDVAYFRLLSRVSVYTGLPIIVGWPWHQVQQRGIGTAERVVDQRIADVRTLFTTTSADGARDVLRRYEVRYVYIGQVEEANYPAEGLAKFAQMADLEIVYQNPKVTIYLVRPAP